MKVSPAVRASAGMVARAVQDCHAPVKFVPESKPAARKDVMEEQPYHAYWKSAPAVRAIAGMEVSEVQLCHVLSKSVAPEKSIPLNFGVTRSVLPRQ